MIRHLHRTRQKQQGFLINSSNCRTATRRRPLKKQIMIILLKFLQVPAEKI